MLLLMSGLARARKNGELTGVPGRSHAPLINAHDPCPLASTASGTLPAPVMSAAWVDDAGGWQARGSPPRRPRRNPLPCSPAWAAGCVQSKPSPAWSVISSVTVRIPPILSARSPETGSRPPRRVLRSALDPSHAFYGFSMDRMPSCCVGDSSRKEAWMLAFDSTSRTDALITARGRGLLGGGRERLIFRDLARPPRTSG